MKKVLLSIVLVMTSLVCIAQVDHMSFKGVPINGKLNSFVSKLEAQGFSVEYKQDDAAVLSGEFAGKSDCTIMVISTKVSNIVWKVVVQFPEKTSWYSLKGEYNSFKESYTKKYGEPTSYEFFSSPYYEGDGYELQALKSEKCMWASYFSTSQGTIILELTDGKCTQVVYEDGINVKIFQKEKKQIVSEDI